MAKKTLGFKKKSETELEITTPQADKIDVWRKDYLINKIADINLQLALLEEQKKELQIMLDKCIELDIKTEKELEKVK